MIKIKKEEIKINNIKFNKFFTIKIIILYLLFLSSFPTITMQEQKELHKLQRYCSRPLVGVENYEEHLNKVELFKKRIEIKKYWPLKHHKWPKNLKSIRTEELHGLQRYCSKMVEYEDLIVEMSMPAEKVKSYVFQPIDEKILISISNVWEERLKKIKILLNNKTIKRKENEEFSDYESDYELYSDSEIDDPYRLADKSYKFRRIYINNKNPILLDLHGVSSAREAEDKVLQFIKAAKSNRKKYVIVITGKGNHVNHRGSKGVLLKSFPRWVENNENIIDFKLRKNGGSYIIFLTPPTRELTSIDFDSLCYLHRIKGSVNYIQKLLFEDLIEEQNLSEHKESLKRKKRYISRIKKSKIKTEFPAIINQEESKVLLQKICQKKKYDPPEFQILDMEFNVRIFVGNLVQEDSSYISYIDAEERVAKKMYEFLRRFL